MLCWYCEKNTMQPDPNAEKGWFRCSECDATWVKVPVLGRVIVSRERDDTTGKSKFKSRAAKKRKGIKK